jgi:hypothetical protein
MAIPSIAKDPWNRPTQRTAVLCQYDGEQYFHGFRRLHVLGTYPNVSSPEEVARAILADDAVWKDRTEFPNSVYCIQRDRNEEGRGPTFLDVPNHTNEDDEDDEYVCTSEIGWMKAFYAVHPLELLADVQATSGEIRAYSVFYKDTSEWTCILSHLVEQQ